MPSRVETTTSQNFNSSAHLSPSFPFLILTPPIWVTSMEGFFGCDFSWVVDWVAWIDFSVFLFFLGYSGSKTTNIDHFRLLFVFRNFKLMNTFQSNSQKEGKRCSFSPTSTQTAQATFAHSIPTMGIPGHYVKFVQN